MKDMSLMESLKFTMDQARTCDLNSGYGGKLIEIVKEKIRSRMTRANLTTDERSQIEELLTEC